MNIISIGSSSGCNICYHDPAIEKRHALIRIYSFGKMEIVDLSEGGTYVNGIRIKQKKAIPIKRTDVISFAGGTKLEWGLVPNPILKKAVIGIIAFLLCCIVVLSYFLFVRQEQSAFMMPQTEVPMAPVHHEDMERPSKEKVDSVDTAHANIPSAIDLWIGSGKKLPKRSRIIKKSKNELEALAKELPTDTVVDDVSSIEVDIDTTLDIDSNEDTMDE